MVLVREPLGGVRICCNLTEIIKAIKMDRYPFPALDDLGRVFSGSKFFNNLDVRCAYKQVILHLEIKHMIAIITPIGLLQRHASHWD